MGRRRSRVVGRGALVAVASVLLTLLLGAAAPLAAPVLSVSPITWDVIGLDSNNQAIGANTFPVGVRLCNTGDATATSVVATFIWDTVNALITLSGSNTGKEGSIAAGACADMYFEISVSRTSAAFGTARGYHISVTGITDQHARPFRKVAPGAETKTSFRDGASQTTTPTAVR